MPFHLMWLPLLAVQFSSFGQEAILKTVPVRLRMEPAAQASWPADVGVVEMTPGLRLPEPFTVFGRWQGGSLPDALFGGGRADPDPL